MLAMLLLAAACPTGQTQVYGTATDNGTLKVYPKDGSEPKTVALMQGQPWSVCLAPTLPWTHKITDEHFNPWWDEADYALSSGKKHEMWAVPAQATADVTKIQTDGKVQ